MSKLTKIDSQPLTTEESTRLAELEAIIRPRVDEFKAAWEALAEIREKRLYRMEFDNFADYCENRWGMSRWKAQRLIDAGTVNNRIGANCTNAPTLNPYQTRQLTKLPPEQQSKVIEVITKDPELTVRDAKELIEAREQPAKPFIDPKSERKYSIMDMEIWFSRYKPLLVYETPSPHSVPNAFESLKKHLLKLR